MLAQRFLAQVARSCATPDATLELLPSLLAEACVQVLPVAGAGISVTIDELRVPLGSSDANAARAEQLQTTLGEGPCLAAKNSAEPLAFDEDAIEASWPIFYSHVLVETPYRSIASVPLSSAEVGCIGALDLYFTEATQLAVGSLAEVNNDIANQISALLFDAPTRAFDYGVTLPVWLAGDSVTDRMNVWVAVGILTEHAALPNADALSALRGYAFGHSQTLDETASEVADGRLRPETLLGSP